MKSRDILAIVRQGRKIRTPWAILYVRQRTDRGPAQISCVVGKKVHRLAVRRHRYQRWLRELFRLWTAKLLGKDLVVVGLPTLTQVSDFAKLQEGLTSYLKDLANEYLS